MVTDATGEIAGHDTPASAVRRSSGLAKERTLQIASAESVPSPRAAPFPRERTPALSSSANFSRRSPFAEIVGLSRFSYDMADASGTFADDCSTIVIHEEFAYLAERIPNDKRP